MTLIRKRADDGGTGVPSRVLGNLAIAAQITAVFGLPLGGVLVGAFGWRALFVVNIPLALLTIAFTLAGVAKDPPSPREGFEGLATALDIPGVILFAGAITGLLVFLSDLTSPQWRLAAATAILATALIFREQRAGSPLIDTRMLAKNLPLQRTYLRQTLSSLGVYAALYGVSQWMEQSAHLSASAVGIILLPLSVLSIVASRMASVRGWVRWPLILAGIALIVAGGVTLQITQGSSVFILVGMTLLFGFTNGFSIFANQAVLYVQAPAKEIAVASGLFRTFGYFGAIFSASLIGIAFGPAATDSGLHALAWVFVGIGAALALLSVFDKSIPLFAND
jgi:predicted MFS family arabinose efflux permease